MDAEREEQPSTVPTSPPSPPAQGSPIAESQLSPENPPAAVPHDAQPQSTSDTVDEVVKAEDPGPERPLPPRPSSGSVSPKGPKPLEISIPPPSTPTVVPALDADMPQPPMLSVSLDESLHEVPLESPAPRPLPISLDVNGQSSSEAPLPRPPTAPTSPPASLASPSNASMFSHRRSVTSATSLTLSQGHTVSVVLISTALETIASSKEARRSGPLRDSVQRALDMVRSGQGGDKPREIFEPLRLACETRNEKLMIASLDCIAKLISYSFFIEANAPEHAYTSPPASPTASATSMPTSLADLVTHTITSAYTESTPDAVSLQIVKALLALVLSPTILVHHSSLLKAVRTVYNVFLLSQDPVNQMVAQGGLTQMVNHIFSRCRTTTNGHNGERSATPGQASSQSPTTWSRRQSVGPSTPESGSFSRTPANGHHSSQPSSPNGEIITTTPTALRPGEEGVENASTTNVVDGTSPPNISTPKEEPPHAHDIGSDTGRTRPLTTNDLFLKDAYLVFRALCKLTLKALATESERDLKSHAMRSKLLSLHLVLTILNSHMAIFVEPSAVIYSSSSNETSSFLQMTKQYLLLSLSRNAVSSVPQVFEISVEIFWRILSGMRTKLKKEIEILFNEIFIPILEMRTSTLQQKAVLLTMLSRLCQDPQALVEIYLNYDCDREAIENIYERLVNVISKIGTTHFNAPQKGSNDPTSPALNPTKHSNNAAIPPSLSTTALADPSAGVANLNETKLKRQSLECLVALLRSLVAWGTTPERAAQDSSTADPAAQSRTSIHDDRLEPSQSEGSNDRLSPNPGSGDLQRTGSSMSNGVDDPGRFESAKQRKTTLLEGIKKFNFKPKRGIQFFLDTGFIPSRSPQDIAKFLHETDGLSKAMIGEYLGEGDEENIAIMHAFVDQMDFTDLPFVDALRLFLQAFRLPGEAQKIDRYMLKFAERYIAGNSSTGFANAGTAYVLAYSTILLNTDAYNPQVKNRMSKADFIKNNRGIDDGADLPEELLSGIYDDIYSNEIRMKDEIEAGMTTLPLPGQGLASALANVGRDLQKEAYVMQSNGMANKTEALFRTMMRTQRKGGKTDQFFSASHFVHVRPMFEVAWMPFLAGVSGPLQDTDDLEVVELCLDGFKSAIRIVCFFDLQLERNAFVTTLAKFTFLNNLGEMKTKNMEAIKTLLDVAVTEGNNLKGSWHEVLTCVSQLERMQLISSGIDVPDAGRKGRSKKLPAEELANESRSTHITVAADMVFSLSHYLSGTAIVEFVQALSDVSWEEIQSSGLSEHPRLFSLQKLVEISYYNMGRIRLEWSNMWAILGEHFNQVCCHNNPHVGFFALDALRQLAMRFLEKEELPHFKFQKDFLKPFEYTMIHNPNPDVRDMVLQCLQQMIQARVQNMRSGWRTMFGVFSAASKVLTERVTTNAFEIVTRLNKDHFPAIVRYGAFADLTVCITDFCKVSKYQKISLAAIGMLEDTIQTMLSSPECSLNGQSLTSPRPELSLVPTFDDPMIKYWFPVLFSFYDIIMNGEDLEVRRLALNALFTTLKTYGENFPIDFWDTVCQELLFPIFSILKSKHDLSRFGTQEDVGFWISTTMIQALRDLIDLYTHFFDILERFLDGLLDLLYNCIFQENDTLSRAGTACFQKLLQQNALKLSKGRWELAIKTFVTLFKKSTPHELFDDQLREQTEGPESTTDTPEFSDQSWFPSPLSPSLVQTPEGTPASRIATDRRRVFQLIIAKCVLQLLLIETVCELLKDDKVYSSIPPDQILLLMLDLDGSYQFARMFNADKDLRHALWRVGFMKHLPNLLKQETSSASTLVYAYSRIYFDKRSEHQAVKVQVADKLLTIALGVMEDFNALRSSTQHKNIAAWTPVIMEALHSFCEFDEPTFVRYLPAVYPQVTDFLAKDVTPDLRQTLHGFFVRVGQTQGFIDK